MTSPTSAGMLEGMTLPDGIKVLRKTVMAPNPTGSNFSVGYEVALPDGTPAFLKAIDFSRAMGAPDPARILQALAEAFNFERDVLNRCKVSRMDHVVLAISEGKVTISGMPDGGVVQYLVMELADRDVRHQMQISSKVDDAFCLRALHNIAVGIQQLHGKNIAHQDLKPSNALLFGKKTKVGDLGRAAEKGTAAPHDDENVAGDPVYCPPEQAYGWVYPDWNRRRLGTDLYQLGSMILFMFTGIGATEAIAKELDRSVWPDVWGGSYADVLPYVRDAFDRVALRLKAALPPESAEEIIAIFRQLCDPDPALRGHPLNRRNRATQHDLQRYISGLNLIASKAEASLSKHAKRRS